MAPSDLLSAFSPLDYICLAALGVFALDGTRRGAILGTLDLAALALILVLAIALYPLVGNILADSVEFSGALANVVAFAAVFIIGQAIYAAGATFLRAVLAWVLAILPPLRALDGVAGLLPGFVKGAVILALFASAVRSLPVGAEPRRVFDESTVVARTAPLGAAIVPDLPALMSRLGVESTLVAPPPYTPGHTARSIEFPPNLHTEADGAGEVRMLELVNQERALAGVHPLVSDEQLRHAARQHSAEMFRLSYFAHDSPETGTPFDRMRRAGATFTLGGENLAYAATVEAAHRGLMNSPEHRRNILSPTFRRVGLGIHDGGTWGRIVTQNFAD